MVCVPEVQSSSEASQLPTLFLAARVIGTTPQPRNQTLPSVQNDVQRIKSRVANKQFVQQPSPRASVVVVNRLTIEQYSQEKTQVSSKEDEMQQQTHEGSEGLLSREGRECNRGR